MCGDEPNGESLHPEQILLFGTVHGRDVRQPELRNTALLVQLPAQAHLMPTGEVLQFLATLRT